MVREKWYGKGGVGRVVFEESSGKDDVGRVIWEEQCGDSDARKSGVKTMMWGW